jgi:hypothetical protein
VCFKTLTIAAQPLTVSILMYNMFHLRKSPCPTCHGTSSIVAHLGSSTPWTILALRDTKWSLARMHTTRMIRLAPLFPRVPGRLTSPVRSLAHCTSSCLETLSTVLPTNLRGQRVSPRAPVYSNIPEAIWGASAKVSGSPVYLLQAPEVIWGAWRYLKCHMKALVAFWRTSPGGTWKPCATHVSFQTPGWSALRCLEALHYP